MSTSKFIRMLLPVILLVVTSLFLDVSVSAGAPLRVHPTNPRYFTDDSGKAVYLTGSHSWGNFHDIINQVGGAAKNPLPGGDFNGYLAWLVSYNHNLIRMWITDIPRDDFYLEFIAPVPYARPGPGSAQDGAPKFDLTQYYQTYFERLHSRVAEAQSRGIYVSVMLFSSWSVFDPLVWKYNPYNSSNNINSIDCNQAPNNANNSGWGCHTLTYPDAIQKQEDYVRHVIDTLNDLDNVLYEICNEDFGGDFNWQYHFIDYVHTYESSKPKQHPVIITSKGDGFPNIWLTRSMAESITPGTGTWESVADPYASNPPVADGSKVQILDTDHIGWNIFINDAAFTRAWVWKSFTRGYNPILMEDFTATGGWKAGRAAMGSARAYADRMNLAAMTPRGDITSTGFALANPGLEYLVYQPASGSFTVQVSAGDYNYEWFDPETGGVVLTGSVSGGNISFTPPFSGDAVLYLRIAGNIYTITSTAGTGGAIEPSATVAVPQGTSRTFTITPNAGYRIEDVMADGVSVGAVSTYTFPNVAGDHSINAIFAIIPGYIYTITATAGTGGTIQPSGAVAVPQGASQTLTITPNAGYHIEDVTVDGTSVGRASTYPFTGVMADHSISATFTENAVIPKLNWRRKYVDSQELVGLNGAATNAFDNNNATIWQTKSSGGNAPLPHEIQINLGQSYSINGFRYLPRQDGSPNGRIGQYEFYVSTDGTNWGTAVAKGTFANSASEKEVRFTAKTGQYVRLRALTEVNGNPWTSMAEITVLSGSISGNQAPNGVIDSPASNMTINRGGLVTFAGTGSDPDNNLPLSYRWNFGTGSGIADSTLEDPGSVQFNTAGTFTVTFTVTDALGLSDPTPATRVITVFPPGGGVIPKTGWSLKSVDSQETVGENGAATNSFDNNNATIWHTKWYGGNAPLPHEIQINLAQTYSINGFRYLPRQDGETNGRIGQYEFYVSTDGTNWGTAVATGTFANSASEKELQFTAKTGQYIRLRALSEVSGNPWTSMAEINVLGILPSANQAPNGVIDSPASNMTINRGGLVTFAGTGSDPDNNLPLSYLWNFGIGSGIANSTLEDPGSVQFNTAGTFTVTFTVTDSLWLADTTPATRVITVVTPANQPPNGVIDSPASNMTINRGGLVTFAGTGSDPDNNLPLSYLWNFGTGSGIANSTLEDPGSVQFNTAGTFTVTFTVTDSLGLADTTPATRVITVVPSGGGLIPKTNWSLKSVDSQELVGENGAATNAFDNNNATIWHTKWYGGNAPLPHEIQINLGQTYSINGFRYLSRQDGEVNGRIKQYEFYVSADGTNWGTAVATGTFANSASEKEVQFTAKTGQYIRLRALSEVNGNPWTSMAEINVLGSLP